MIFRYAYSKPPCGLLGKNIPVAGLQAFQNLQDAVSMPTSPGDDTGIIDSSLGKPDTFFFCSMQSLFHKRILVSPLCFIMKERCAIFFL